MCIRDRRGREEKTKSRDLSNRSVKTDRETESGKPTYGPLAAETEEEWKNYTLISRTRERGRKEKKQEQRSE